MVSAKGEKEVRGIEIMCEDRGQILNKMARKGLPCMLQFDKT